MDAHRLPRWVDGLHACEACGFPDQRVATLRPSGGNVWLCEWCCRDLAAALKALGLPVGRRPAPGPLTRSDRVAGSGNPG